MHIKFMAHGQGSGRGAANYLTQEKDHNGVVRSEVNVLKGDPYLVADVADNCGFKHKYTSGVIAWAPEDKPTQEQIDEVLEQFEKTAFAGLEKDQYAFSAVLHGESDGGVHVHVLAAKAELTTGKQLNIAPPGWEQTYDPVRDYFNEKYEWARPDDPDRARMLQPDYKAYTEKDSFKNGLEQEPDARQVITDYLLAKIQMGAAQDRENIVATLEDAGLEVTRQGKKFISVKVDEDSKAIRLKGAIYEQDYKYESVKAAIERDNQERPSRDREPSRRDKSANVEQIQKRLQQNFDKRAEANKEKFKRPPERSGRDYRRTEKTPEKGVDNAPIPDAIDFYRCMQRQLPDVQSASNQPNDNGAGITRRPTQTKNNKPKKKDYSNENRIRKSITERLQSYQDAARAGIERVKSAAKRFIRDVRSVAEREPGYEGPADRLRKHHEQFAQAEQQITQSIEQRIALIANQKLSESVSDKKQGDISPKGSEVSQKVLDSLADASKFYEEFRKNKNTVDEEKDKYQDQGYTR